MDAVAGNGRVPRYRLQTTDKFGVPVFTPRDQVHCDLSIPVSVSTPAPEDSEAMEKRPA